MSRLLLPREHGAYVQLLAPLTLSFALTGGNIAASLFALAALLAFMANEPLLVVLGHRGKRLHAESKQRATRMVAAYVAALAIVGVTALALADWPTRILAAALAVPAALLVVLAVKRRQRTLLGELFALVVLAGAAAPVASAAGMPVADTLRVLAGWIVGYGCSVVVVHRVIDRGREPRGAEDVGLAVAFLCIAAVAVVVSGATFASTAAPLALSASVVALIAPKPTRLRAIGFAMVGASMLAIVATVAM